MLNYKSLVHCCTGLYFFLAYSYVVVVSHNILNLDMSVFL